MRQFRAIAANVANSTALRFSTGKAPGMPRHTGQTLVLGRSAEARGTRAENLRRRQELNMHFEADDGLVGCVSGDGGVRGGQHIE